jgi:hypothetical protein
MEPVLVTEPRLAGVLEELVNREPLFHRLPAGAQRADYEDLMAPEFWEVGASGRRYSRDHALDVLVERSRHEGEDRWETSEFHCLQLCAGTYLLTYTLLQGERRTRRATIWRRAGERWEIVFHQGTIVQG